MGVFTEIWARDIANNIFRDDSFIVRSKDDTMYVSGKKVHLPQSGTNPGVAINRTVFPANATQRTDTELEYTLDSYTTDPAHITNVEELQTSYEKRISVLGDHVGVVRQTIADWMLVKWAPAAAARIVRTTGGDRLATAPSATGNRKKVVLENILNAKRILDNDDVPQEGRVMVVPSEMYNDLLLIDGIVSADKFGQAVLQKGVVAKLLGFDIYIRSRVLIFTNAATPVVVNPGTAGNAAHNIAALFYHESFVRRALGETNVYVKENDPQYYGDVMSAEIIAGGQRAYDNQKGLVVLVEAHGS
jgi:hypothetical protein